MSSGSVSGLVTGASADNAASVLMARKALDVQKQQGEANVKLIESTKVEGQNEYKFSVIA